MCVLVKAKSCKILRLLKTDGARKTRHKNSALVHKLLHLRGVFVFALEETRVASLITVRKSVEEELKSWKKVGLVCLCICWSAERSNALVMQPGRTQVFSNSLGCCFLYFYRRRRARLAFSLFVTRQRRRLASIVSDELTARVIFMYEAHGTEENKKQ